MSAVRLTPHHPETPQARVHQALKSLIYRIGVRESARMLDCDEDTVSRRLATGHINAFGCEDLIKLKKRERDEFGTRDLHDAETDAIYPRPPVAVMRVDLATLLHQEIGEDAGIIGRATKIVADGRVDAKDLPDLEAMLPELHSHIEHAQELESGIRARIGALKSGGR